MVAATHRSLNTDDLPGTAVQKRPFALMTLEQATKLMEEPPVSDLGCREIYTKSVSGHALGFYMVLCFAAHSPQSCLVVDLSYASTSSVCLDFWDRRFVTFGEDGYLDVKHLPKAQDRSGVGCRKEPCGRAR